jgi:glycosyltransferase involved in cell wall biosynthesis
MDKLINNPSVSVIMSVYNGERFLKEAVESILAQSFTDLEFIIIDDGSTDQSARILENYNDSRIIRIKNASNIGLTKSLNLGLKKARGFYIARIDADDISKPGRLAAQIAYLNSNPQIAVLGSAYETIDENSKLIQTFYPPSCPLVITWSLLFGNPIAHSSVVYRRDIILQLGGYDENILYAQDYDLWSRITEKGFMISVLNIPLIQLRNHKAQITLIKQTRSRETALNIARKNLQQLLGQPVNQLIVVCFLKFNDSVPEPGLLDNIYRTFDQCLFRFTDKHLMRYDERRKLLEAALIKLISIARFSEGKRMMALNIVLRYALRYSPASLVTPKLIKFAAKIILPAIIRQYFRSKSSIVQI